MAVAKMIHNRLVIIRNRPTSREYALMLGIVEVVSLVAIIIR
jgi:hypothetical protein